MEVLFGLNVTMQGAESRSAWQGVEPPEVCIIIPTYNRVDALPICLAHLERQTFANFEVILVDDGSTDGTAQFLDHYLRSSPLRVRVVRQENSGPARARNRAIALAGAPLSIIIGDDILCSPQFCASHVEFHRNNPEIASAALGLTVWSQSLQTVTPFMRWMDDSGTQFAYGDLLAGVTPDWRHFYTSNLSVKTELLRKHPFSEEFPFANVEDMELGYRLEQREGMTLAFLPAAFAEHLHPIDFLKACLRAQRTGLSLRVFDRLWPAWRPVRHITLKNLLTKNAWLLPPLTQLTNWLTRFACPNFLIRFTLAFHTEVARRRGVMIR